MACNMPLRSFRMHVCVCVSPNMARSRQMADAVQMACITKCRCHTQPYVTALAGVDMKRCNCPWRDASAHATCDSACMHALSKCTCAKPHMSTRLAGSAACLLDPALAEPLATLHSMLRIANETHASCMAGLGFPISLCMSVVGTSSTTWLDQWSSL